MANKQTGGTRLTGLNPLSYMGVEPSSPPNFVRYANPPTTNDFGFDIGTIWLVPSPISVYMLVAKPQNVANWLQLSGGTGAIDEIITQDGAIEATAGAVTINSGANINIPVTPPSTITVNLDTSLLQPTASADQTQGWYSLGGLPFMHNYSATGLAGNNTFVGSISGNPALTGTNNTGHGFGTLSFLTTGVQNTMVGSTSGSTLASGNGNTALGYQALSVLSTGSANVAVGQNALNGLTTGVFNIGVGATAGQNYTTESSNLVIGNSGTIADAHAIRIGKQGILPGQHNKCYIAGIYNTTVGADPVDNSVVNVDSNGQLGQVTFISSDDTIAIAQTARNTIDIKAVGGGGGGIIQILHADNGLDASAATVNIFGGPGIDTAAGGGDTVTINANYNNYGTAFSQPFLYILEITTGNLPGMVLQYLGATQALVQKFDALVPNIGYGGPGGAIQFTAPETGIYNINFNLSIAQPGNSTMIFEVITTQRTYIRKMNNSNGPYFQDIWTITTDMNIGDTALFACENLTNVADFNFLGNDAVPLQTFNATSISGFRVS